MVVNMDVKDVSTLVLEHARTHAMDVGTLVLVHARIHAMDVSTLVLEHARTHVLEVAVMAVAVNIKGCAQHTLGITYSED